MNAQKFSISLPPQLFEFINNYQASHHQTRSEVIREALNLLQQAELQACYRQANQEIDDAFEITTADGLEDETW